MRSCCVYRQDAFFSWSYIYCQQKLQRFSFAVIKYRISRRAQRVRHFLKSDENYSVLCINGMLECFPFTKETIPDSRVRLVTLNLLYQLLKKGGISMLQSTNDKPLTALADSWHNNITHHIQRMHCSTICKNILACQITLSIIEITFPIYI